MEECCGNCRYWEEDERDEEDKPEVKEVRGGACRRFPPSIPLLESGDVIKSKLLNVPIEYDYPETKFYQWCGEWRKLDETHT